MAQHTHLSGEKTGNELTLAETQRELVPLIRKFQQTCAEAGVRYFAAFGTLIGAVRHRGFIPWDDDVDMVMTDADFIRFRDYCGAHAEELLPYRFMGPGNTPGYPFNLWRFCDTSFRMEGDVFPDAGMGTFIDVYRLSPAGNDPAALAARLGRRKKIYYRGLIYNTMRGFVSSLRNPLARAAKYACFRLARIMGPDFFRRRLEALGSLYDSAGSRYLSLLTWEEGLFTYPREWFEKSVSLPFEDIEIDVPAEYDAMLRADYGDYMKLPPESERIPHHFYHIYRK